ncbi:MAG TPA: hypothetical protein VMZ31_13425 [Phycisphaerae bacterium]|nr:hypothetical protein [Phycisphaerae bacterium]
MLVFWRVRYLDTRDGQFKDRDLWLETNELDATTKAAVELCVELREPGGGRDILRFRQLFQEKSLSNEEMNDLVARARGMRTVFLVDYFEDEHGEEVTYERMGPVLTGDPNTVLLPRGAKQHDVDLMFAPKPAVDLTQVQVSDADLNALAHFSRDYRELNASSFLAERSERLLAAQGAEPEVATAVSDDEIRSFVTIFRRLYMCGEPGNFAKAAGAFARALGSHPLAKWVQDVEAKYQQAVNGIPHLAPFAQGGRVTFTRKCLIDAFIYTLYAHQGNKQSERDYADCLAQVNGKEPVLLWLFLQALSDCARHICYAGMQIASFTEHYCKCHGITPTAVRPAAEYADLGELEKESDREARIFEEKAKQLAEALWQSAARPEGGPERFLHQAREQLRRAMGEDGESGANGDG